MSRRILCKGLLWAMVFYLMPLYVGAAAQTEMTAAEETETTEKSIMEDLEEPDDSVEADVLPLKIGTMASTEKSVLLTWPLEEKADYGYRIYVKRANKYVKVGTVKAGENLFLLEEIKGKALEAGTSYTVKVVALERKGKRTRAVWHRLIRTSTQPSAPKWVSVKRKTQKKAALKWTTEEKISGYELQISTKPKKGYRTIGILQSSKKSVTIKNLKKGKKYYVRIRTYRTVTGGKVFGQWSEVKKI